MGPFDVEKIHRRCYALKIPDVASTYGECHILSNRSDTSTRLREVILRWQQLSAKPLKTLRTNNHENLSDTQNHPVEKLSHPPHVAISLTPKTYKQAVNSPDKAEWMNEIENELLNMKRNNVFKILPIPSCVKSIGGGWVFVKKPGIGTEPARFKAQYVARGNSQLSGVDLHETFAPTATFSLL
ncbi:hypothetical protein O181_048950 [Austropuccinia psidii MF-1]|uniref:Reverse transcriptase Ty1/copia-type domain-containing protein n=1 Tax=Austropuccinia psidii MF-1 TaxID=1389203 RepID=A0A9Q3DSS0_9BASI|nr:hypothetical protein [Austropuccinia psidii MF-1]